ncbi:hypothetical protein [Lewinella sp. W8]|uniref:hypothetical protein n=1 Tax=Lewinella sp. W8 TaxID=2528208 RepID=UPI0010684B6C|nr:hypothetical protein [Lewinella sp. W8]MTB49825.1 hypothetical protein [Lewinella sp. W8]
MRFLLTLLLFGIVCTCVRAQVNGAVDAEYTDFCMVDSLPGGQLVRFRRLVNISTLEVKDINPVTGGLYTVAGTLFSCEEKDAARIENDPLTDFYENCQCTYTSSQQDHRVIEIRGGLDQDYTVEYQEVVTRKCSSESSPVVIFRDTLIRTDPFRTTNRIEYQIEFTPGQYVDDLNVRRFLTGQTTGNIIIIDLDPATVQATYPGLTLNAADFTYDGSNLAAMATAYQTVLDHVFPTTVNQLSVSFDDFLDLVIISTQYMHEPTGTYVILPGADDLSFGVSGTASLNGNGIVTYAHGLTTSTSDYPTSCGETINTVESAPYFFFDPLEPRTIQTLIGVDPAVVTPLSNPFATCDAPPELCASLATSSVAVDGCLTICDTVTVQVVDTVRVVITEDQTDCTGAQQQGHQQITNTTGIIPADTYHSATLIVLSGTVAVTINGVTIDYPAGLSTRWAAPDPCDFLSETYSIDATNGSVLILTMQ